MLRKAFRITSGLLLTVFFLLTLQYCQLCIYHREQGQPFSGNHYYNPYETYSGKTLKANFHAHSIAWMKLSNGAQQPAEIYKYYREKGYGIISISNYEKITRDLSTSLYIPAYEHGYNFFRRHQLVLNADKPSFFDFPLFQTFDSKQQVIDRLKTKDDIVVLAHPDLHDSYTVSDMKYLTGYDMIEVFNYKGVSDEMWDAALSSGHAVWMIGDDDCHNISNPSQTLINWTRVSPVADTREAVVGALRKGCHYCVRNTSHEERNFLDSCKVTGGTIKVYFRNRADKIVFISDNGSIRKEALGTDYAEYTIAAKDSYVRVEAITGEELLYLNPVIRCSGLMPATNSAAPSINVKMTILLRVLFILTDVLCLLALLKLNPRLRRSIRLSPVRVRISLHKSPVTNRPIISFHK